MIIKLDQFELQTAIEEYLSKHHNTEIGDIYTETFLKHTRTKTKDGKPLKRKSTYECFWYGNGYEYNDEQFEIEIFVDRK